MVMGVLNEAFDVLVLRFGVQKRIYCNVSASWAGGQPMLLQAAAFVLPQLQGSGTGRGQGGHAPMRPGPGTFAAVTLAHPSREQRHPWPWHTSSAASQAALVPVQQ